MIDGDHQAILQKLLAERRQPMARWKPTRLHPIAETKGDLTTLTQETFPPHYERKTE